MLMTKPCYQKGHFNLYYIFLEDKQNNALSEEKAAKIKREVLRRLSELKNNPDSG